MRIATEPGSPGALNEDFAGYAPGVAVVVDGATAAPGVFSGCRHSVAWYARTLGGLVLAAAADPALSLAQALELAIEQVHRIHSDDCDLTSPHSPSATLALARTRAGTLEYLVLCDATVLLDHAGGTVEAVTDDRLELLRPRIGTPPSGVDPETYAGLTPVEKYAAHRNHPDGFWVASTDPRAAHQAITGTVPLTDLRSVSLLTDGATRVIDLYTLLTWPQALDLLRTSGPADLIRHNRKAEATDPARTRWPRGKPADDATALHWPLS